MSAFWSQVFGNDRPVEIEIGPGRGDVLVAFATARPDVNFFAIERIRGAAERVAARLDAARLTNARVVAGDAACVVHELVPAASVAAYHLYFPDPWPKRRHHKRRLVRPSFAADLRRTLARGGVVHVATDLGWLFDEIESVLVTTGFAPVADQTAPDRPITRFERKYARAGTFTGSFSAVG